MISINSLFLGGLHFLRTNDHLAHNLRHDRLSLICCLLYLLVAHLDGDIEASKVSHHTNTKDTDATVMGHDHLRHSAHTYGVATKETIHLIFGRGLEGRSLYTHIDAILQADLLLACNFTGQFDQFRVVGLMHIRETWTRGEVLATQRMLRKEVDMVGDDHQVTNLKAWVHATCGIADEERLDSQFIHHTYREGHFFHRITLIEMEAAFHGQDIYATQFAEDQSAAMSLYGRDGEVGNLLIGDLLLVSNF